MADQADGLLSPWLRSKRIDTIKPFVCGNILDFGCGVGVLTQLCEPDSYVGIDVDEESLEIAKRRYPTFRFANTLTLHASFDTIIMLAVLEHLENPERVLKELGARLRVNGNIVLTTPKPIVKNLHRFGASLGLFSANATEEHENFYDYSGMQVLAEKAELSVRYYRAFLFHMNQLFVLGRK